MRVAVRVRPGARQTLVGGAHAGALVVRVAEPAIEGRATEATLRALAAAFRVGRGDVALVRGATSRMKVVDVRGGTQEALDELLAR